MPLIETTSEFRRWDIADGGIPALPVVEDFNIFKKRRLGLLSGYEMLVIDHLQLDRAENNSAQTLSYGVPFRVHTGYDMVLF